MEMWFSDEHTEDVKLSIRVREQLFSAQSEFQQIRCAGLEGVRQNPCCGRRSESDRKMNLFIMK